MDSTSQNNMLLSLDDIIKNREIKEQHDPNRFRHSKFVNLSLNEFVKKEFKTTMKRNVALGRFDRPSLRDDSDNEADSDQENYSKNLMVKDDDIEMNDMTNEHIESYENQLDPENNRIKRFETIEQVNNIQVSSQAWRLENKNIIVDRPKNMPCLTTLGSKTRCDNNNRVQTGRINKVYRNPYNDYVNGFQTVKTGQFVEKGGFTYKHDQNGLIGIDRQNKTFPQTGITSQPQINIHMDLKELFKNVNEVQQFKSNVTKQQPTRQTITPQQLSRSSSISSLSNNEEDISKLKFAAADLIAFLKSKKN
ncbi:unnamed protein product [Diamesa tonsa]